MANQEWVPPEWLDKWASEAAQEGFREFIGGVGWTLYKNSSLPGYEVEIYPLPMLIEEAKEPVVGHDSGYIDVLLIAEMFDGEPEDIWFMAKDQVVEVTGRVQGECVVAKLSWLSPEDAKPIWKLTKDGKLTPLDEHPPTE
jgi:hypothetical protein